MKTVARLLLIAVLTAPIPACEKWSWPPYEESLRELFAENKDEFEKIRQSMLADNLELVNSAYARGRAYRCAGEGCPSVIEADDKELQAKYSKLVGDRSIFQYWLRDGDFRVTDVLIPPTQGGDFYFNFVWSEKEALVPHCNEKKARLPTCGACYKDLDPNWHMYWWWYPQDLGPDWDGSVGEGLPTPDEILEQTEAATEECLKAGWEEMELKNNTS